MKGDIMKKLITIFTVMVIFGVTAFADMSSSLTIDGRVAAEVVAIADDYAKTTSGNLTLSTIPVGASIVSATLYAQDWFQSSTPTATFAGTGLGSTSAFASDTSAGGLMESYKWDVTSLITGNGVYAAYADGFKNNYGLTLAVVYSDPTLPFQRVVVNDGALQLCMGSLNDTDTESTTFNGFIAGAGNLWIHTGADDAYNTNEQIIFNGSIVGGPINLNIGPYASLFNIPVTTLTGMNTAQIYSAGDWFGWDLAVLQGPIVPVPGAVLLCILGLSVAGVKLRKHA